LHRLGAEGGDRGGGGVGASGGGEGDGEMEHASGTVLHFFGHRASRSALRLDSEL
jgi:hypothetical protein